MKNTIYDLQLRLQRIDDKVHSLTQSSVGDASSASVDLGNERQVTARCLQICQDAKSFFESLTQGNPNLLQGTFQGGCEADLRDEFEAQLLTRQIVNDSQQSLVKTIARLRERLELVVVGGDANDRSRLQEDIQMSKKCLEVCTMASNEVTNQKIHIIGEVTADGDSDHVVVTTLADMFKVGKSISKNRSALLVGSMSDEALMQLSYDRYNSRYGLANTTGGVGQGQSPIVNDEASSLGPTPSYEGENNRQHPEKGPPTPNEMRKRTPSMKAYQTKPRDD